jgi:hypothetical protein
VIAVPAPGYVRKLPTYPAVADLRKTSGAQDSWIEMTEVFLREGLTCAAASSIGLDEHVRALAKKHGVVVGPVNLERMELRVQQMNIVQVHLTSENFFDDLLRQYAVYKQINPASLVTQDGSRNLSSLERIQRNSPAPGPLFCPEADLIEYYRLVRNHLIHHSPSAEALNRKRQSLLRHRSHFASYSPLSVPNAANAMSFADFMLFTRAVKYFANLANDAFLLEARDVANLIARQSDVWAKVKQRNRQPKRLLSFSRAYIQMYHLRLPDFSADLAAELQAILG